MFPVFPHLLNQSGPPVKPEQVGRSAMLVVGVLMFGLINFAVIFLIGGRIQDPNAPMIVCYLGLASAGLMAVLRFIIPEIVTAAATRPKAGQTPEEFRQQLAGAYQTKVIIGAALLEGAGFFNGVAYVITGSLLNMGAIAVLLTVMAVTFPSQSQFDQWADQIQRDTL